MNNPKYNGFEFVIAVAGQLPELWSIVEYGIKKIHEKARLKWPMSSLGSDIAAGRLTLTMIYYEDKYAGFVVTRPLFLGNEHYLQGFATYLENWVFTDGLDGVKAIVAFLEDCAKRVGSNGVVITFARKGWEKKLFELGYGFGEETVVKGV